MSWEKRKGYYSKKEKIQKQANIQFIMNIPYQDALFTLKM